VIRSALVLVLWASVHSVAAQSKPVTFIGCPIYRDTDAGRKSGCWLADDASGVRYDISLGPVKPQVGRLTLVEGAFSDEPDACGGRVLDPVRIAVLDDACERTIIPADNYPGRPFKAPPEMLAPTDQPRSLPPPPYSEKQFTIYFEYGRDFLIYQYAELILEKIALYAQASRAQRVHITGFAATEPLKVDGRTLSEPITLARARAEMVAEALRRLGIAESRLSVTWQGNPKPSPELEDGKLPEASKRRVAVAVIPSDERALTRRNP
jgi:outer membrane protein OmpA-like peptidoglycan-associated protein